MSLVHMRKAFPAFTFKIVHGKETVTLYIMAGPIEPAWDSHLHAKHRFMPVFSTYKASSDIENYVIRCIKEEMAKLFPEKIVTMYFGKDHEDGYVFDDSYYK